MDLMSNDPLAQVTVHKFEISVYVVPAGLCAEAQADGTLDRDYKNGIVNADAELAADSIRHLVLNTLRGIYAKGGRVQQTGLTTSVVSPTRKS